MISDIFGLSFICPLASAQPVRIGRASLYAKLRLLFPAAGVVRCNIGALQAFCDKMSQLYRFAFSISLK